MEQIRTLIALATTLTLTIVGAVLLVFLLRGRKSSTSATAAIGREDLS